MLEIAKDWSSIVGHKIKGKKEETEQSNNLNQNQNYTHIFKEITIRMESDTWYLSNTLIL